MKLLVYLWLAITIVLQPIQNKKKEKLTDSNSGWWIYGENQHLFKDENTLSEWALKFSNEDLEELSELYLAVAEMEYFPMECIMEGILVKDTLLVVDFEITYVQGCGENTD